MICAAVVTAGPASVPASAQGYAIKTMTPDIQHALEARRQRYEQLTQYKREGLVGETNRGYVEAFSDDAAVRDLAAAENEDRQTIYASIAEQNGASEEVEAVEKAFAQEQRDRAEPGMKIQNPDGSWGEK